MPLDHQTQPVIIGGGIAGLGAALFAQRKGVQLRIYEKHPQLEWQDNLLWLAPNGLHLIAALDLLAEVRALAVAQSAMLFSSKHLQPLVRLDCDELRRSNGFPILAIKRRDLYRLMLERFLKQGGELRSGYELTGLRQTGSEVYLRFNEGTELACNFAIGADGIGSTTRRLVFPASQVSYAGIRLYLGRSSTPASPRFVGTTTESWGVGTRFITGSLDGRTTYFSAAERTTVYEKNSAPIAADVVTRLQEAFSSYHPDVRSVLEHAEPASIHRSNFGFVTGLKNYSQGRVFLIGDAAHGMPPNMGQGASLALEDAYGLTELLLSPAGVKKAEIERYSRTRRKRVEQMVQICKSMNTFFQPKSRLASTLRDTLAHAFPQSLSQRRMAHLYKTPFVLPPS